MQPEKHSQPSREKDKWHPKAVCDGGDLDCGSGLLLIIRKAMNPLSPSEVLEIRSRERSVAEDLPAWCRMVKHEFLGAEPGVNGYTHYFVRKGQPAAGEEPSSAERSLTDDMEAAKGYEWRVRVRGESGQKARVYSRNHVLDAGKPADFAAKVEAPSAVDYLMTALGACLTVGFQNHAARYGATIDAIEFTVRGRLGNVLMHLGIEEEGNPGLVRIAGTLYVTSPDDEALLQEIWQTTLKCSPVLHSLNPGIHVDLNLSLV
jgi:TusA-related sulfurtransferase/uncharacterized OsmC-like protein